MDPPSPRVVVIGSSCAGKTTFARALARARCSPHIELDELFWSADWQPKPPAEFRRLVAVSAGANDWVADGNYGSVRPELWPRATTVVWLDFGLARVLCRGLRRTLARAVHREELWHGNRESLGRAFFSRDSLLLWIVKTFHRRRREFRHLRESGEYGHLTWHKARDPGEAKEILRLLQGGNR